MIKYDRGNKKSIIDYAKKLKNKTLKEVCGQDLINKNYSNKGSFGQLLEEFYFEYKPNSVAEADFAEVGLELKASPLKLLSNSEYRSKERLVLNIISYLDVAKEDFETSSFWNKNANLLLIFYLYEQNKDLLEFEIKLIEEWSFNETDLEIIKKDWELIRKKIIEGKAHELSEGDTFYLGACTKGSKGGNPRPQHNSSILAKQRAYSLKQGYVNHIIATIANEPIEIYGKLISSKSQVEKKTIVEIVQDKFKIYYTKSVSQIEVELGLTLNKSAKNYYANLVKAILGVELKQEVEEFKKSDVTIKTVRIEKNNLPRESVSFPSFEYEKLILEDWDESEFKDCLEKKFLFVFFKIVDKEYVLNKVKFWNMPQSDISDVKRVWTRTREIVQNGDIVSKLIVKDSGKNIRSTNFPGKKESHIAHVRPHAKNSLETYSLPVQDKVTGSFEYTKHCFWLNNFYIRDEIYLK